MKVKIGNKIYDSNVEPIMLILDKYDKKNIANMDEDASKFCTHPDDEEYTDARIRKFMKTD